MVRERHDDTQAATRFGLVLRKSDGEKDQFKIEVYAHDCLLATHKLPGSFSSFRGLYDEEKRELLFLYSHGTFYRIGIGVLNLDSGVIVLKKLIQPDIQAA